MEERNRVLNIHINCNEFFDVEANRNGTRARVTQDVGTRITVYIRHSSIYFNF